MPLLSSNILVCELVLWEKTDVPTVIRAMSAIGVSPGRELAHFFAVAFLCSHPGDSSSHSLRVDVTTQDGRLIARADAYEFSYGYKLDPSGPGGFILTTEFNLSVSQIDLPVNCLVAAFLDAEPSPVAQVPLMLRRI